MMRRYRWIWVCAPSLMTCCRRESPWLRRAMLPRGSQGIWRALACAKLTDLAVHSRLANVTCQSPAAAVRIPLKLLTILNYYDYYYVVLGYLLIHAMPAKEQAWVSDKVQGKDCQNHTPCWTCQQDPITRWPGAQHFNRPHTSWGVDICCIK